MQSKFICSGCEQGQSADRDSNSNSPCLPPASSPCRRPASNGLKPLMWFSLNLTVYGQFNTSTSHRSPAPAMITAWDYGPAGGDADSDVLSCWLAPGPPSRITIDRKCGTEFATHSTSMPWAWCTSTSLASRMLMEVGGVVGFFPLSGVQKEACL